LTDKLTSLEHAIAIVPDGALLALGGNTLHRSPCAAVHELIRQRKRGLELVKTAGAYDVDVLCGAGCVTAVHAGFIAFENVFGLAPRYRKAVEEGRVQAKEHACYTVIAGLRAAIQGVPFMPVAGLDGSDLVRVRGFQQITDPYTGRAVTVIPALRPDVAILHVHEADGLGNARIYGSRFEDVLMAEASAQVIVTAERIVTPDEMARQPELTAIPGFLVTAVVEAPRGAWPSSCAGLYDYDEVFLREYIAATAAADAYGAFLDARVRGGTR